MTEEKYSCGLCGEEFQDGEIVAKTSAGNYHHSINLSSKVDACFYKAGDLSWSLGMYHNGKLHNLPRLREFLSVKGKISIKPNREGTGEKFTGDLEELIEPLPEGVLPSFV